MAQAVGPDGAAVLDLPAGESREYVRALGARNIRVVALPSAAARISGTGEADASCGIDPVCLPARAVLRALRALNEALG